MKKPLKHIFFLFLGAAILIIFANSCKKDEAGEVNGICKVAFILNQTNAAGDTTFVEVPAGTMVQNAPAPERTGFKFDGWYTSSADANPDPNKNTAAPKFPAYDISKKPIYLDMILYARWIK